MNSYRLSVAIPKNHHRLIRLCSADLHISIKDFVLDAVLEKIKKCNVAPEELENILKEKRK